MIKIAGIYIILNLINGKYYIGSSLNMLYRWKKHRERLRRKDHHNNHLQSAWNKYTESSFVFIIIEQFDTISSEKLGEIEQKYLDFAKQQQVKRYNLASEVTRIGSHLNEQIRLKISAAHRGKKHSLQTRIKMSLAKKGKPLTKEHIKKMQESRLGKIYTRNLNIYSFVNIKTNEIFIGNQCEFYRKFKLRQSSVNKMVKRQTQLTSNWKLSETQLRCRPRHTEEYKKLMSDIRKGKPKSPEHIANMDCHRRNKITVSCPYCNKIGQYTNMKRWHFEKCQNKSMTITHHNVLQTK
ncbi:MAG: GIY-YIG nuclease family protein [bacterium]|nr:GIY-YIG nuclease family protein [bacterium]